LARWLLHPDARVLAVNAIKSRKVYVVDSFEGLPPPKSHRFPHDEGLNFHLHRGLAVSLEQVKDNFSRYGLLDEQVVFVKGLFQDTLLSLAAGPFGLMRLDGDLYESTYVVLEALYPKLSPGRVCHYRRLWSSTSLPSSCVGLPNSDGNRVADPYDRLDRFLVAETLFNLCASVPRCSQSGVKP
jgi:hypothetical protein